MELYNKIMVKVWLLIAIVAFLFTTYKCITEDYRQWYFYYIIVVVALVMWAMKLFMVKRMKKHLDYLENQNNGK
jgi:hypothetical protein